MTKKLPPLLAQAGTAGGASDFGARLMRCGSSTPG